MAYCRTQAAYLVVREIPVLARSKACIANRSDRDAPQCVDGMTDRVAHFPHLTVASFVDRQLQGRAAAVTALPEQPDRRRRRALPVDDDAARQTRQIVRVGHAEHARLVDAR